MESDPKELPFICASSERAWELVAWAFETAEEPFEVTQFRPGADNSQMKAPTNPMKIVKYTTAGPTVARVST